jgi:hypothetical protein
LDENTIGNMFLEVIVEDTYFKPWQSDFIVEEHTSVKVKVNEQKESSKPIVEFKTIKNKPQLKKNTEKFNKKPVKKKEINTFVPKKEIAMLCEHFGIHKRNFKHKRNEFSQIIKEYFKANTEYKNHVNTILSGIGDFLK